MATLVLVEVCIFLLFCAALFSLRRTLTPRTFAFWLFLWLLRGAGSLLALRYAAAPELMTLLIYTPVQAGFALAILGVAVRLERQKDQLRLLEDQLTKLKAEAEAQLELDPLTELSNRSALDRWMEEEQGFDGLVVVCDLDDFKALNDRLGHLVGDEILRDIGQLMRASIRHEDRAFRWGGDEFVICFRTQDRQLVEDRLRALEQRLHNFHIRNHGPVSVRFSWGVAAAAPGRSLRESIEKADRRMYEFKRLHRPDSAFGTQQHTGGY